MNYDPISSKLPPEMVMDWWKDTHPDEATAAIADGSYEKIRLGPEAPHQFRRRFYELSTRWIVELLDVEFSDFEKQVDQNAVLAWFKNGWPAYHAVLEENGALRLLSGWGPIDYRVFLFMLKKRYVNEVGTDTAIVATFYK